MTLVQFIVNFLRPYADMPEFTTCVMKALKELGHGVTEKSISDPTKKDPARFKAHDVECDE
jgi:hypothetical protein